MGPNRFVSSDNSHALRALGQPVRVIDKMPDNVKRSASSHSFPSANHRLPRARAMSGLCYAFRRGHPVSSETARTIRESSVCSTLLPSCWPILEMHYETLV